MTQEVPEASFGPWTSERYEVDSDGKLVGAVPGQPNNWARWGQNDQLGTLNLVSSDRVAAAASLIRTGKRFSLGLPIGIPAPGYRPAPLHFFRYATSDALLNDPGMFPGMQISDDYLMMALQGTTQIDGLCHVADDDSMFNGYWAGGTTAAHGARRLGIHHFSHGVAGRGILLDVARYLGVEYLEVGTGVGPSLLDEVAENQGVTVGPGDILLIRTGFVGWWFQNQSADNMLSGGLSATTIPWLAEHDVAMVGADNIAVEGIGLPDEPSMSFHIGALRNLGLPLGELFDLDSLARDCAEDGVYEFFLSISPLPVVNGAGSPINPIAFK